MRMNRLRLPASSETRYTASFPYHAKPSLFAFLHMPSCFQFLLHLPQPHFPNHAYSTTTRCKSALYWSVDGDLNCGPTACRLPCSCSFRSRYQYAPSKMVSRDANLRPAITFVPLPMNATAAGE